MIDDNRISYPFSKTFNKSTFCLRSSLPFSHVTFQNDPIREFSPVSENFAFSSKE